jgi:hypothetical protein
MLDLAKSIPESDFSRPDLWRVLIRILTDPDIQQDNEVLHQDWANIFEQAIPYARRHGSLNPDLIQKAISLIDMARPLDAEIYELSPTTMKIAFLLGAGASKPAPSNIPTVKELLPELLVRARRLDREDVTTLADFCDKEKIDTKTFID